MEAIKKESVGAYEWLLGEPVELWARYTFPVDLKCPNNTTNFVESFNGKIELFRYKPIYILLEEVRRKFMKTIANRFNVAKTWVGHVVPRVKVMLRKIEMESRCCIVTPAGRGYFEVLDGKTTFTVNLDHHHCDCMVWDIIGIPCKHGIRCILRERHDIELYVHEAYTISSYLKTYDVMMHPIKDPVFWKQRQCPQLSPPPVGLARGRPPNERRRDKTEQRRKFTRSNTLRWSTCKQFGHNSRSHREGNVLDIRRGKDKARIPKIGCKRRVGRPSKADGSTSKKSKTAAESSSQPTPPSATEPSLLNTCIRRQTRSVTAASRQAEC